MSLLQEIIDGASGDDAPTTVLLRKVKILAARLGTLELATWADKELNGYEADDLPPYRGPFSAEVRGDFAGSWGSSITNALIPSVALPEEIRDSPLFEIRFSEGVAALEDILGRAHQHETREGGGLAISWPSNVIPYVNMLTQQGKTMLYEDYGLTQARKPIGPAQVRSVLDAIRNRVLDLALALEAEDPTAGDVAGSPSVEPERATSIFHTVVYGAGSPVAIGSSNVTQNVVIDRPHSDDELVERLAELGVPSELLDDLRTALEQDSVEGPDPGQPGPRVTQWLGKIATIAAKAGGKIGTQATAAVVTQLVLSYLGG